MNINAQQAILNAYILNNSRLYKDYIFQGFISDSDFNLKLYRPVHLLIQPSSYHFYLYNLKLQGLQEHLIPFGLISISFLSCILPSHNGQLITIFLLINLCSFVNVMVLVSSSLLNSKSSGMGFLLILVVAFAFGFFGGIIYIILQIIYKYFR